jgi:CheY-like chemotaxis protein
MRTLNILMIEDDADDVVLFEEGMNYCEVGYNLQTFTEANAARTHLAQTDAMPDIIVLDLHLGGANGLEILGALKAEAHTHNVPVLVLTGVIDPAKEEACRRLGAVAVLQKPVQLASWQPVCTVVMEAIRPDALPIAGTASQ